MSTHPAMKNVTDGNAAFATTPSGQRDSMVWLLRQFASETQGVTHAVLLSRDGLRLLDSDVDKDWADELSAAFSGVASLAANITGPSHKKRPARQVIIERDDCLFFVQSAGCSAAFDNHPGNERGEVDTILAVIATRNADVGTVGFEMGRLVAKFAPYMVIPVRVGTGGEVR
ncbi:roadblock/LC7 domain-containing protein [Streptomyces sp. CT1-17]|uniref:roadblock/LC7 domain-containing protein n=1 Tax=unclassified Streptomyces TaxID=2593676 RepID=UPI001413B98A|nr:MULTISPECIES: roadblock/LC7 domain-containing protein [unclassified Streptomyces]MCC2269963.1 roadblock/LC7 domain-containing protein [Streptomyces sp. CT1-17]QIP73624.1 roadblock/LC7 domain-containing protein [Streptomyces sp. VN1]